MTNAIIAFHSNQLALRGADVALYDYAHHNETLLGNRSIVVVPSARQHHPETVKKFQSRFPLITYAGLDELNPLLVRERCNLLYCIKQGSADGVVSTSVPTAIHCVAEMSQPHGQVYAGVSEYIVRKSGQAYPSVPFMVDLPAVPGDLRAQLNIPPNAIVFGRHGGWETFNLEFVKRVVTSIVNERTEIHFIFMHTEPFADHPRIRFLDPSSDMNHKTMFINSCDAMLHARTDGETFGLACAEFSNRNKPVITYACSEATAHLEILGDKALRYENEADLHRILSNFQPTPERDWNAYAERCNPVVVMDMFRRVFLEPFGISLSRVPPHVVPSLNSGSRFWILPNDNLSRNLLRGEEWEPHIRAFMTGILKRGDCVVDAGAAFGFHTVTAAKLVGQSGRVHAFEPQRAIFELLQRNIIENSLGNVRPYHFALAHQQTRTRLSAMDYTADGINVGGAFVNPADASGELTATIRLDQVPIEQPIRLIKIDVQGLERFVIQGAEGRIRADRPVLIVEFEDHCLRLYGYSSRELFEQLRALDYVIFFLDYSYPSDHVCVPREREVDFRRRFSGLIVPHAVSNPLNHNFELGIREKIIAPRS